mmetsp:Transcript_41698/g.94090  ORF Transcript_41698/g.94090 Transcript_41698/m.94090 type:complete len:213 (+) Transcript_41698:105-743(+)
MIHGGCWIMALRTLAQAVAPPTTPPLVFGHTRPWPTPSWPPCRSCGRKLSSSMAAEPPRVMMVAFWPFGLWRPLWMRSRTLHLPRWRRPRLAQQGAQRPSCFGASGCRGPSMRMPRRSSGRLTPSHGAYKASAMFSISMLALRAPMSRAWPPAMATSFSSSPVAQRLQSVVRMQQPVIGRSLCNSLAESTARSSRSCWYPHSWPTPSRLRAS